MATADFKIKTDDTFPPIEATLLDATGAAVDLTNATVKFHMSTGGVVKVNAAATLVDAATGKVKYQWVAGDTDTAGSYQAEWEVTFQGGDVATFPNTEKYLSILISKALA